MEKLWVLGIHYGCYGIGYVFMEVLLWVHNLFQKLITPPQMHNSFPKCITYSKTHNSFPNVVQKLITPSLKVCYGISYVFREEVMGVHKP